MPFIELTFVSVKYSKFQHNSLFLLSEKFNFETTTKDYNNKGRVSK